jgi:hypothetical protein
MNDTPRFRWRRSHTLLVLICLPLWAVLWYGVGALLYFVLTLR